MKAKVTERAVLARVNRVLKKEGQYGHQLQKVRADSKWYDSYGPYMEVDLARNTILSWKVDLEAWARELGVLAGYEEIKQ